MNDHHFTIILEDIRDQNKVVLKAVGGLQEQMKLLASQESVDQLTTRVKTIETVLTADRKDFIQLEERVARLETKVR